jgi:hypothetical protein
VLAFGVCFLHVKEGLFRHQSFFHLLPGVPYLNMIDDNIIMMSIKLNHHFYTSIRFLR